MKTKGTPWPPRVLVALAYFVGNSIISKLPFYGIRHAYLRKILGFRIGHGAAVHMGFFVTGRSIFVGDRTVINRNCYLDGRGGLQIGEDVSISPECYLVSLTHDSNDPDFSAVPKPIRIEKLAWLGARAMILPGVHIGEGAVVGAGAVVTRSVDPYTIVAGNPARKIGERSSSLRYRLRYFPWFDTDVPRG
jgi:acetyltransferase-like isoleucine patch superfamily enzyme